MLCFHCKQHNEMNHKLLLVGFYGNVIIAIYFRQMKNTEPSTGNAFDLKMEEQQCESIAQLAE